jgi:hypothetical protein
MKPSSAYKLPFIALIITILSACGGGEDNPSPSPSPQLSSQTIVFEQTSPISQQVDTLVANKATAPGTGEITYDSNNTNVATVDIDGYVTLKSEGTAVISAHKAADSQYREASNSYTINAVANKNIAITAWIGSKDTLVKFPQAAVGAEFYRTSDPLCNPLDFTQCSNGQFTALTTTSVSDSAATLNRAAYYLLKKDGKQSSLAVDLNKYTERSRHQVVTYKNELWLIGGFGLNPDDGQVVFHNDVWSSTDGAIWTLKTAHADFSPRAGHQVKVFNNQLWLFGGTDSTHSTNDVWSSTDGIHWTQQTQSAAFSARADHQVAVFNNKLWLIGGIDDPLLGNPKSDIWSSSDGINWTQETSNAAFSSRSQHQVTAFKNKLWLVGGHGNTSETQSNTDVWSSVDGKTWVEQTHNAGFAPRYNHQVVAYRDKLWLTAGNSQTVESDVWSSADGVNWKKVITDGFFNGLVGHQMVTLQNKLWVLGGRDKQYDFNNNTWSSNDGANWSKQTTNANFNERQFFQVTSLNDRLWLIGSTQSTSTGDTDEKLHTFSSSDTMNWKEATLTNAPSPRLITALTTFNNQLWIIGGSHAIDTVQSESSNDVWSSADGSTWVKKTENAQFSKRNGHSVIGFKDKLWLVGGQEAGARKNDIWSSVDGITWTLETAHAEFPARMGHKLAVFNNKLWLTGSDDGHKDIWSSSDGVHWQQQTTPDNYLPDQSFGFTAYDDKLWIIHSGKGWFSTDGTSWTAKANKLPPNIGRLAVHNNQLLVIGPSSKSFTNTNEVWSSTDGEDWHLGYRATFQYP